MAAPPRAAVEPPLLAVPTGAPPRVPAAQKFVEQLGGADSPGVQAYTSLVHYTNEHGLQRERAALLGAARLNDVEQAQATLEDLLHHEDDQLRNAARTALEALQ